MATAFAPLIDEPVRRAHDVPSALRPAAMEEDECLALLAAERVGRVAVLAGDTPLVLPVNFVLAGRDVLFRTGPGAKLAAALAGARASFQVDRFDALYHRGWSVLLAGAAREVRDPDELAALCRLPLRSWVTGADGVLVRIVTDCVSGRRIPA